jgi:hypothetical protein
VDAILTYEVSKVTTLDIPVPVLEHCVPDMQFEPDIAKVLKTKAF